MDKLNPYYFKKTEAKLIYLKYLMQLHLKPSENDRYLTQYMFTSLYCFINLAI